MTRWPRPPGQTAAPARSRRKRRAWYRRLASTERDHARTVPSAAVGADRSLIGRGSLGECRCHSVEPEARQPASVPRSSRPESTKTQCTATSELLSWVRSGPSVGVAVSRDGHDHVGGSRAVDQLIESIDCPQDGNGIGLGMERQMTAAGPQTRGSSMTPHRRTRRSAARSTASCRGCGPAAAHRAWPPTSTTRLRAAASPASTRCLESLHESPPIPRRRYGSRARKRLGPIGLDRGTYHPWQTSLETVSFKLFDRPVRR